MGLTAERLFTADDFESDGSLKFGIPKQEVGADKLYPGDIKYVDMNGDGKITEEDEGYIGGTEDPRIVYGFGGVIAYKNIDFNFFFQGTADAHRVIGNSTIFLPGSGTTVQGMLILKIWMIVGRMIIKIRMLFGLALHMVLTRTTIVLLLGGRRI